MCLWLRWGLVLAPTGLLLRSGDRVTVTAGAMSIRQRQLAALKARFLTVSLDPLRISLFMLMVMTVSRIHQHFRFIAKLHPGMVLVFAVGAYALMNPKFIRPEILTKSWVPKVIFALAIQACLS